MKIPLVRRVLENSPPFLSPIVTPYYQRWYGQKVAYESSDYRRYQSNYWNTVGQWRWANSFDYSDVIGTLSRYYSAADRTLVELGCGKGSMLAAIHRSYPTLQLTGVDAAERMCTVARRNAPEATIINEPYGKTLRLQPADIVVARSTLTYVDENDISDVLAWIASVTKRLLLISDISAINDEKLIREGLLKIERLSGSVYKRLHDHSHIRDYSQYPALGGLKFVDTLLENAHGHGNRQWIFLARS
jgi:SAM-dependent methyltransferase